MTMLVLFISFWFLFHEAVGVLFCDKKGHVECGMERNNWYGMNTHFFLQGAATAKLAITMRVQSR